ncbi:subtilisin-like serine protease [Rhizobium leguminosarum bv. trifolii WSM597]|uniref:Subtilisin-like serine protease n=1 Tax=Rhizobium leguminosarum bv. trifolii WSM597 TaxID=754764 RepID=J0HCT2_RHILT|nr:subtilisin-like serine protease [Rhizobium leguminosarum bv. trifolii WSM597]EJB08265.1 subtilisin-like serine protease [Rhizobium leguminosarum bv. trifolii WSM597]
MAERLPTKLTDEALRGLVLGTFGHARWTQDSPIVPDVWISFVRIAEERARARLQDRSPSGNSLVDLIITPWTGSSPGKIAQTIRSNLARTAPESVKAARIATSSTRVVASLDFGSLMQLVIPLTGWWQDLTRDDPEILSITRERSDALFDGGQRLELIRFAALVAVIIALQAATTVSQLRNIYNVARNVGRNPVDGHRPLSSKDRDATRDIKTLMGWFADGTEWSFDPDHNPDNDARIWLVNLNRPASQAMFDARKTVKADAAQKVFDTDGKGIVFAIIDNGIDLNHVGFLDRDEPRVKSALLENERHVFKDADLGWASRVRATYDFSLLRDLLAEAANDVSSAHDYLVTRNPSAVKADPQKSLQYLSDRAGDGRGLDWALASPLIRRTHDGTYVGPAQDHGTHVAGILGASFKSSDSSQPIIGVCEKISMFDLRVFDAEGQGDEFAILMALEFVRWVNRDRENPVIHGVNMSLAIKHDVDSFGCGRTPVCDACNQLVGSGVVVVVAAGNMGFEGVNKESLGNGYRTVSITDPGNAEDVITVGSTHRRDPHAYGVSYFSSRGPTGDGRRKPDILAPGEKITSTIRGNRSKRLDGTSMAAPHVAGAAALLMARYPELIGQPRRIKKILMETATDLGREPAFQGAGLVDILRAMQSV